MNKLKRLRLGLEQTCWSFMISYAMISFIATAIWLLSLPFVGDRVSNTIWEIASKSALISLPFLAGTIAFVFFKSELPEREDTRIQAKQDPITSVDSAIRFDCRFLNPDSDKRYLVLCAVEPDREDCSGCQSYTNDLH